MFLLSGEEMKDKSMKMRGSRNLRMRLLLSTLSLKPIIVHEICSELTLPGLSPHEISLICLFDKISDGCVVQIDDTGTKLRYRPGTLIGGRHLEHDCGTSRSIGYFLESLIVLGLFTKKPLTIRLKDELTKPGNIVVLRNAKINMFEGSMRLAVGNWGCMKSLLNQKVCGQRGQQFNFV